jgi:hypothetical protein
MKRGLSIQFRYVNTCRLADRGRQSGDVYLFYTVQLTFNYGRYARGQLATAICATYTNQILSLSSLKTKNQNQNRYLPTLPSNICNLIIPNR